MIRVGSGFDVHAFGGVPPLILGGVVVDDTRGLEATSDGDAVAHAVSDAVLGAANLGDMGTHFPSSDPRWVDANSLDMLSDVVRMASDVGVEVDFVDVTVVSESVRISDHRREIAAGIARAVGIDPALVSVKATSTDGLGFVGRDEGLAVLATVTAHTTT